jgi:hypothetical protein
MYVSHFDLIKSATLGRFDSVNVWACHFSSLVVVGSLSSSVIVIMCVQLWGAVGTEP